MAKRHVSLRLEAGTVDAVESWAEARGLSRTDAVEALLSSALGTVDAGARVTPEDAGEDAEDTSQESDRTDAGEDAGTVTDTAVLEVLRASCTDLRQHVSTLTAQLEEKDAQIRSMMETNAGLLLLTNQAQQLQAAEAHRLQAGADAAQIVAVRPSWRERLARWIARR